MFTLTTKINVPQLQWTCHWASLIYTGVFIYFQFVFWNQPLLLLYSNKCVDWLIDWLIDRHFDGCTSMWTSYACGHLYFLGVFGSGKSFLLAVIVLFIVTILDMERMSTGILHSVLISSLTNVAVDRVLSRWEMLYCKYWLYK